MPKITFRLSLVLTLFLALSGCYEVDKLLYQGTIRGVSLCVENKSSTLLSEETVMRWCIKEHQSRFTSEGTATAFYTVNPDRDSAYFELGGGLNDYDDVVITEIHVSMTFYDADGKSYTNSGVIDTWVEPTKDLTGNISVKGFGLPEDLDVTTINQTYCSDKEQNISCRSWNLIDYRGLKI
jgi:hypothetical protein